MPADPFSSIRTLSIDELAELASFTDLDVAQPFDDVPDFDAEKNPEIDVRAKLPEDKAFFRTPGRRLFVDYRPQMDAYKHLRRLPREGESMHGVISGKYALLDLVPALIERTKQPITDLYLCTLGFSKRNGADLCGLLDDGHVRRFAMVCSYYFEKTSPGIYDEVVPQILARGHRVKAMRAHAKLIVARMKDGAKYVCESSANLRSSQNLEQFVLTRCPKLYRFHRRWLEQLLKQNGPNYAAAPNQN